MARYKNTGMELRLLAVDLPEQLAPGTFEHALDLFVRPHPAILYLTRGTPGLRSL